MDRHADRRRCGFTLLELVCCVLAVLLLIAFILPAFHGSSRPRYLTREGTHVREIHQSFVVAGRECGRIPTPGALKPLPDEWTGLRIVGVGEDDRTLNHTAPLYAMMVMQNYFAPDMLIGTTEVSDAVRVYDEYDYDAYDPANGVYWDDGMRADLAGGECHVSYAHMALCGRRFETEWSETRNPDMPMFGNRGPAWGATSGPAHDESPTLRLHGAKDAWVGQVCFNDNHTEILTTFTPAHITYTTADAGAVMMDSIFDAEFGDFGPNTMASGDAFMVICTSASADGQTCTPVWDVLLD